MNLVILGPSPDASFSLPFLVRIFASTVISVLSKYVHSFFPIMLQYINITIFKIQ